jgi:hypothetical protein
MTTVAALAGGFLGGAAALLIMWRLMWRLRDQRL